MSELWTRAEVARHLRVSLAWLDSRRHKLPQPIYVGRLPRWEPEQVMEYARSGKLAGDENGTTAPQRP